MKLRINGNYILEGDRPFFWLGDTAWQLFSKLNENEIYVYLKNRKSLGFNVIQVILIEEINERIKSKDYWDFVSKIVDYARDLNIYMALLPCWGSVVKSGGINEENVVEYVEFLSKTFQQDNIIWVVGGDIRGDFNYNLFNTFGSTLKELNPDKLVTFHPFGRTGSYLWFNDCDWLDFNMFQSGHRRYDQLNIDGRDEWDPETFGESNYKYVIKNFMYENKKPCLDAEPSYEGVVQGLHNINEPYWEACHIRRYAYFNLFEGACGHTYGNNAIIQFYTGGKGNYGVREMWYDALHSPGGAQLQYLKNLMESFDFINGKASQELIIDNYDKTRRIACFSGENYILCYTYNGDSIKLNLINYKNKRMNAYWMNPENNSRSYINTYFGIDVLELKPVKKRELSNDWVLILEFE